MSNPWQDAVAYRMPNDPVTKNRLTRAANWLKSHLVSVPLPQDKFPIPVIAWKDPTLEQANPKLLAGYVITDTLWSAKALKVFDPIASQDMETGLQHLGWYGNGLHDVLFHPIDTIRHRPADQDYVHGLSLGRFPITDGRVVDLRVFRQKWDAEFSVGHPSLFAEHAVYQALFDFWQGRREQARHRILEVIQDDRARNPRDRIFWDDQSGILVDYVNYDEWLALSQRCQTRLPSLHLQAGCVALRHPPARHGARDRCSIESHEAAPLGCSDGKRGSRPFRRCPQETGNMTMGRGAYGRSYRHRHPLGNSGSGQPTTDRLSTSSQRAPSPSGATTSRSCGCRPTTWPTGRRSWTASTTTAATRSLLWVAGAFRSKKYPITWKYNADHENVRKDFVRDLIDHAHARGIKVLLGFTPFGYDGVNQYPLEHPETEGRRQGRQAGRPRSASAAGATTSARRGPSRSGSCWNTSGRWPSTSTRTPTAC